MEDFTSIRLKFRKFSKVTVTDPFYTVTSTDPSDESKTIEKPKPLEFQLRKMLQPEEDRAKNKADEYNAKYIDGGYRNAVDDWCSEPMAYMPFLDLVKPDENGDIPDVPELGYGLLIRCANIEEMQPAGSRYNMDQLLVMSVVLPNAYSELVGKANLVALGLSGEPQTGNASKGESEKQETS